MKILKMIALLAIFFIRPLMADGVKLNEKAPDFELLNQDGKKVKLSDYAGKNIVIAFSRAHW